MGNTIGDSVPGGQDALGKRIADLERKVRELGAARTLEQSSIGGERLTPSGFYSNSVLAGAFPVPGASTAPSGTVVVEDDITVPAAMTTCKLMAVYCLFVQQDVTATTGSMLYGWVEINGVTPVGSPGQDVDAASSAVASVSHNQSATLTGLTPGSTITVQGYAYATFDITPTVSTNLNFAQLSTFAVFSA